MNKTLSKYTLFLIFCVAALCLPLGACSNDDVNESQTEITYNDLPSAAIQFLRQYFRGEEVVKVSLLTGKDFTVYTVELENCSIDFNEEGEWQQIDAKYGETIPGAVLPEPVQATLQQRYPGFGVNQITKQGQNYIVVLTNNQGGDSLRLEFDQSGEILNTSQVY